MQLVLVPAEAITVPVGSNLSHAVHLMPALAELVRQLFPVLSVPQLPRTPSWIWEHQTHSSLGFESFFFIISKTGLRLVNQDWPKKRKKYHKN